MELAEQLTLMEIFEEHAAYKRRMARALEEENERVFEEHRQQKQHQEEEEKKFFDDLMEASDRQIATFRNQLEDYDTGVVHALMDNEHALDDARKRREELESSAFRLPDGRMVFKTEDGKRVFDQRGAELSLDTVDPHAIPDSRPQWETFKAAKENEQKLQQEREKLLQFQKKVDDARAAVDKPGITAKQLDELDADLKRNMPEAVRQKLSGNAPAPNSAEFQVPGTAQTTRVPDTLRVPGP
ncbi:hypothetical protein [Methylocapsa aurea]|uniref:hypothetical protein n=1 Tax=Methylocapsa aurea TaxID=663610 RepID=UPI00056AFC0E|nr:hypothetical protein [Methylocapsa aurea]